MSINTARKKWLAVLLCLIMPGLGQIYCGELLRGICFLVFFIFSPLLAARVTVIMPDCWMLPGIGVAVMLALSSYIWAFVDGWRLAIRSGGAFQFQKHNSPVFYVAVWLVGMVMILASDQYLRDNVVEAYKIVGKSMVPMVLPGDYVLVKKPAYRNQGLKKGDIIIAIYPDDRSKALIRQIDGLPGEVFVGKDGITFTVPHGTVMVKGSSTEAVDSSTFGPLDMRDIVGRVTQIYFSKDEVGMRWSRIAKLVNS
jgi:signal peptidase I